MSEGCRVDGCLMIRPLSADGLCAWHEQHRCPVRGCREAFSPASSGVCDRHDVPAAFALLDDIREHLWSCGPPADGWGRVDRGRDSDQQALLARINDALEPQPQTEVSK